MDLLCLGDTYKIRWNRAFIFGPATGRNINNSVNKNVSISWNSTPRVGPSRKNSEKVTKSKREDCGCVCGMSKASEESVGQKA